MFKTKIMPDISMCEGKDCPLKETCYRYRAIPSEFRQSYYGDTPYDKEKKECKCYDPIKPTDRLNKKLPR